MTSADLLIVLVVGTAVGALTGVVIGTSIGLLWLAVVAGLLGTIIGAIVRNYIISRGVGVGPDDPLDDARTPQLVIIYAVIASLAGSTAALEISQQSDLADAPFWIGTLAGLFSAILMAMLMITYHTHPGEPPKLRRRKRH